MKKTIEGLYAQIALNIRRYVSRFNREYAEDIAQETVMVLLTNYKHLDQPSDLVPLSVRIAKLKMREAYKKRQRAGNQLPEAWDDADDRAVSAEQKLLQKSRLDQLHRAIGRLGSPCLEMLRMMLEGADSVVLQQTFHLTANAFYVRMSRCRGRLATAMGGAA